MKSLALVIPCYNEEKTIPIFYNTVEQIKQQIRGEESSPYLCVKFL